MNLRRASILTSLFLLLSTVGIQVAHSEVDPFPNVSYQGEVPGTRIWSAPGVTQSTYEATPEYLSWIATGCPAGTGNAVGVDMNFTETRSDDRYFNYCTKTWRPAADIEADAAFERARQDGQAQATGQSLAWNQAHPGQQKCFQWGPVVHANGITTASGGACANVVPATSSPGGDSSTAISETQTAVETSTTVLPVVQPTPAITLITSGLGGYAVIHPDGHVCGVTVSTSIDPFNNGGVMPQEYMGCPAGSRFAFQTTPSESGNVAGWHGENVRYDGTTFTITNGNSVIRITNGIATDENGRSWDTGTNRIISPGVIPTPPISDTKTAIIETPTVVSQTPIISLETTTPVTTSEPVATVFIDTATIVTPTPADDLESLPEVVAEEEISNSVEGAIIGNKTRITVVTQWSNTRLSVVASKKGMKKKYTYRFTTNSEGEYIFKSGINLKGYTLVLFKGAEELDRDWI